MALTQNRLLALFMLGVFLILTLIFDAKFAVAFTFVYLIAILLIDGNGSRKI